MIEFEVGITTFSPCRSRTSATPEVEFTIGGCVAGDCPPTRYQPPDNAELAKFRLAKIASIFALSLPIERRKTPLFSSVRTRLGQERLLFEQVDLNAAAGNTITLRLESGDQPRPALDYMTISAAVDLAAVNSQRHVASLAGGQQQDFEPYLLQFNGRQDAGRPSVRGQIFSNGFE